MTTERETHKESELSPDPIPALLAENRVFTRQLRARLHRVLLKALPPYLVGLLALWLYGRHAGWDLALWQLGLVVSLLTALSTYGLLRWHSEQSRAYLRRSYDPSFQKRLVDACHWFVSDKAYPTAEKMARGDPVDVMEILIMLVHEGFARSDLSPNEPIVPRPLSQSPAQPAPPEEHAPLHFDTAAKWIADNDALIYKAHRQGLKHVKNAFLACVIMALLLHLGCYAVNYVYTDVQAVATVALLIIIWFLLTAKLFGQSVRQSTFTHFNSSENRARMIRLKSQFCGEGASEFLARLQAGETLETHKFINFVREEHKARGTIPGRDDCH